MATFKKGLPILRHACLCNPQQAVGFRTHWGHRCGTKTARPREITLHRARLAFAHAGCFLAVFFGGQSAIQPWTGNSSYRGYGGAVRWGGGLPRSSKRTRAWTLALARVRCRMARQGNQRSQRDAKHFRGSLPFLLVCFCSGIGRSSCLDVPSQLQATERIKANGQAGYSPRTCVIPANPNTLRMLKTEKHGFCPSGKALTRFSRLHSSLRELSGWTKEVRTGRLHLCIWDFI